MAPVAALDRPGLPGENRRLMEAIVKSGNRAVLHDARLLPHPDPAWLETGYWLDRDYRPPAWAGRGPVLAVTVSGIPAVLRRYRRGGLVSRLVTRDYVFTGWNRSRGFREWRVLRRLREAGLPVPEPLAASCERRGPVYRAGLLTRRLEGTRSLTEVSGEMTAGDWERLGNLLARFFAAGTWHPDLNAGNILMDTDGGFHLIDFDRARIRNGPVDGSAMLGRLERSLRKLGCRMDAAALRTGAA